MTTRHLKRSVRSMSLHLMASKRRVVSLSTPPPTPPSPFLVISALSTILLPSLFLCFPHPFPLCLTLFIFTVSTLLCSNVFPVCLTGGYRQEGNLSQGQTDSATTDCYKLWRRPLLQCWQGAFLSRYALVALNFTPEMAKPVLMCICAPMTGLLATTDETGPFHKGFGVVKANSKLTKEALNCHVCYFPNYLYIDYWREHNQTATPVSQTLLWIPIRIHHE